MACLQIFDANDKCYYKFDNEKSAVNYTMNRIFNVYKSKKWYELNKEKWITYVNEYNNCLYYKISTKNKHKLIFNEGVIQPKTVKELKRYMLDGGKVYIGETYSYSIKPIRSHRSLGPLSTLCDGYYVRNNRCIKFERCQRLIGYWTDEEIDLRKVKKYLLRHELIDEDDEPEFIERCEFEFEDLNDNFYGYYLKHHLSNDKLIDSFYDDYGGYEILRKKGLAKFEDRYTDDIMIGRYSEKKIDLSKLREFLLKHKLIEEDDKAELVDVHDIIYTKE